MEIADLAAALRGMAGNVDVLAERHDVKDMAQLRREAAEHEVARRRDADLIDELRRQLKSTWRSLDAIGGLRKIVLTGHAPADVVQILADALIILAGPRCSTYTSGSCRDANSGKTRGARFTAYAWCGECVAWDALERAGVDLGEDQP